MLSCLHYLSLWILHMRPKYWQLKLRHRLNSNTWQTATMVLFIVLMSVALSIWLFWRTLYLPELKNHASYLASELKLIDGSRTTWAKDPDIQTWLIQHTHIKIVDNNESFPKVRERVIADAFTDILEQEVQKELGRPIEIFFKFKPTPKLWIKDSKHPDIWLAEPISHYSKYSTTLLIVFVIGLPLMTILIIVLLVRAAGRPLKQLEKTATNYLQFGEATPLPTNRGSNEIRQVNHAFNRLFSSLIQSQHERNIMLAGISHDLRTPLTRMRLTAEMLGDAFFKEGLIYDIEDMDAILEQFISFMKDGSDEAVKPTQLDTIYHEIMVQFNRVQFIYEGRVKQTVLLRPLSIKRLIVNLVNNAIRYGKEPIHLVSDIIPPSEDNPTPTLLLCVKDEGEGVAEDQLARIMQPFERGETARTTQGSGLGLAIVERIAALHQGYVEAINHPDGGLQVCVYLPALILEDENTEGKNN